VPAAWTDGPFYASEKNTEKHFARRAQL